MSNPVLVEVTRGNVIESRHRGAAVVMDAQGRTVLSIGDVDRPVFPRSAVKLIQALPLIETGAADAFGFGDRELALACASHSGEPAHAGLAAAMLERAGLTEADLGCGVHWPFNDGAARALAAEGRRPSQLHNNCSGKHSAFLCGCRHCGFETAGYVAAVHPWQEAIREAMEAVTGAPHIEANRAVDGCSIPTYAIPLKALAAGFARLAGGVGVEPGRARAAKRLMAACMSEPWYVAGTDKMDTTIMQAGAGRLFVKTGAEGVYCAAIPELGLGIALKCDDGAGRAAEVMVAALLARLLPDQDPLRGVMASLALVDVPTRLGASSGTIRTVGDLGIAAIG